MADASPTLTSSDSETYSPASESTPFEPTVLTLEQLESWNRDGFLLLKSFWTPDEVKSIASFSSDLEAMEEKKGNPWKYYCRDDEKILERVEYFHHVMPSSLSKRWEAVVTDLFSGDPATIFKEKINFKKPGSGGFAPHQDAQAGWEDYGHTLHISAAVAIDKSTVANGALQVCAGRHKEGLLGPKFESMPEDVVDTFDWQFVEMDPADLLVFDSYVPHQSEPNSTKSQRRLMLFTYNRASEGDARASYHADKLKHHPPRVHMVEGVKYRGYKI